MGSPDYLQAVVEFVSERGWDTSVTTVRDGVYLIAGRQDTPDGKATILAMVVTPPQSEVSTDHVAYLLQAGRSKNVDNVLVTGSVEFADDAAREATNHGVDILDPARVSGSASHAAGSGRALLTRRRLLAGGVAVGGALVAGALATRLNSATDGPNTTTSGGTAPQQTQTTTPTPASSPTQTPKNTPTPTPTFRGERYSTAFLGNSYTANNDLPGLYQSTLRGSSTYGRRPLRTESVTAGGRRLHQHVDELQSSGDLASFVGMDNSSLDAVVLQEQSQIPGFSPGHPERKRSIKAAVTLAGAAAKHGAQTVLFMTWGRRTGDEMNPELYPDFETMQRRLADGYRAMAEHIEKAGHPVSVAPVGTGFRVVYNRVAESGSDPATEGTPFWDLYAGDGSHPSLQGSYLAALVIAGTATDVSPTEITYSPDAIGSERTSFLQDAAASALGS